MSTEPRDTIVSLVQSYGNYGQIIPSAPLLATVKSSLHECVRGGDLNKLRQLLSEGIDVDEEDERGWTALHMAAAYGRPESAKLLIDEYDAEINLAEDTYGATALHLAAWQGHIEIVKVLLEQNASVNAQDGKGNTPLHVTSSESIAEILVNYNTSIRAVNKEKLLPLQSSAKAGNIKVFKFLLPKYSESIIREHITTHTEKDVTLLHWALRNDVDKGIIKVYLTEQQHDLNTLDQENHQTPAHIAVSQGRKDIVKLLLARGAKLQMENHSWTLLHQAVKSNRTNMVVFLIAQGADINAKDGFRLIPLHLAAQMGLKKIVELLLRKENTDINAIDSYWGGTALHIAASNGHKEIVELLLDKGADSNAKDNGRDNNTEGVNIVAGFSALQQAARYGHKEVVELLLDRGADINDRNNAGFTALHYAETGTDFIAQGKINWEYGKFTLPSEYTLGTAHTEIVKLLIARGANK